MGFLSRPRTRLAGAALVAVVALVLLALAPAASAGDPASASGRGRTAAAITASARADRPAPAPPLTGAAVSLLSILLASALVSTLLVTRHRHRAGDDGDDWRSLLVGAPPATA